MTTQTEYLISETDRWYSEADEMHDDVPVFAGSIARPPQGGVLPDYHKRCVRCGVVRSVNTKRFTSPICRDCKGVMTKAEQQKWGA